MFGRFLNLLKTEPALIMAFAQALLSLLIGAGLHLTATQTGAILAVVSAAAGLAVAIAVRERRRRDPDRAPVGRGHAADHVRRAARHVRPGIGDQRRRRCPSGPGLAGERHSRGT